MVKITGFNGELPKFEIGDIVQLKSGGVNMTIRSLQKHSFKEGEKYKDYWMGGYYCIWFENGVLGQNLEGHNQLGPFQESILM